MQNTEQRFIFHVDVNSAFLSWTAVDRLRKDPGSVDLRTIPAAICADPDFSRSVVTAKSIPAKKYGVQTGEPTRQAMKKCRTLKLVRADFGLYRRCSAQLMDILHSYTDLVQQISIDEAFMDVSALIKDAPPAQRRQAAQQLAVNVKDTVRERLHFTVNVGVAHNKLLAKMASDFEKPDKVHTLFEDEIAGKMWPLPIGELYGCGQATSSRLISLGIKTIGDAAAADMEFLQQQLGEKAGRYISESARGIDDTPVSPQRRKAQSYSNEETTAENITADNYQQYAKPLIRKLSASVAGRLKKDSTVGSTVTLSVKTDDFRRISRQVPLDAGTNDGKIIADTAWALFEKLAAGPEGLFRQGKEIRLIGVGVPHLSEDDFHQLSMFDLMKEDQKYGKVRDAAAQLREKYGQDVIFRASDLEKKKKS